MNDARQAAPAGRARGRAGTPRREELAGEIQAFILEAGLVSGDELPFEGELASRFGVSRTLIRESLRMLEAMKIIRTVHGKGAFVREPGIVPTVEQVILRYRSDNTTLRSLAEARYLIEAGAVELAVQRVTERHLQALSESLGKQREALERGAWDRDLDTEFHLIYLSATENPLVSEWAAVVAEFFAREVPILRGPGFDRATVEEHSSLGHPVSSGAATSAASAPSAGREIVLAPDPGAPGDEGYSISARPGGSTLIAAAAPRGLLYGAARLAALARDTGRLPQPEESSSRPRFPIREWSTHALQGNFNLPLGGSFDRPLAVIEEALLRIIAEAPRHGVNRLQLCGRAGEGIDIGWLIPYRFDPGLAAALEADEGPRRRRRELIRRVAEAAHARGVDLLLWDHELVFPPSLLAAHPELVGTDYPVCFSKPFWDGYLEAKLDELYDLMPEVDGVTLTFAETRGYNILDHAGCRCADCRAVSTSSRLERVLRAFAGVSRSRGKLLEVRSYNERPAGGAELARALSAAPENVTIMTKYTVVDFRGTGYPDDPLIGAFRSPQIVEFTLAPEANGYGFIPADLCSFYRERITRLAARGVTGFVGRLDYHLQYADAFLSSPGAPLLTFDTENEINIECFSALMWDPESDVEALRARWARRRYGEAAAPAILRVLGRTGGITQGIYYVKGIHGPSQLDQVTTPARMRQVIGDNFLVRYFPDDELYASTTRSLLAPDEAVIASAAAEKERALRAAEACLRELGEVEPRARRAAWRRLERRMRLERDSCGFWRWVTESFLRLELCRRPGSTDDERRSLMDSVRGLLESCIDIEREHGRSYPVYNAARGITAYELIPAVVREARGISRELLSGVEDLWLLLARCVLTRGEPDTRRAVVRLPPGVRAAIVAEPAAALEVVIRGETGSLGYPLPPELPASLALEGPGAWLVEAVLDAGGRVSLSAMSA